LPVKETTPLSGNTCDKDESNGIARDGEKFNQQSEPVINAFNNKYGVLAPCRWAQERNKTLGTLVTPGTDTTPTPDDSISSDEWFQKGLDHSNYGQWDLAIKDFTQAINNDPQHIRAYYRRGIAYRWTENHDNAINDFNSVISKQPENYEAYQERALCYIGKENYNASLSDIDAAIKIKYDDFSYHYIRGFSLFYLENYVPAVETFRYVISGTNSDDDKVYGAAFNMIEGACRNTEACRIANNLKRPDPPPKPTDIGGDQGGDQGSAQGGDQGGDQGDDGDDGGNDGGDDVGGATGYWAQLTNGAVCRDGWRSYATGSGACSWHGGVFYWTWGWYWILY